MLTNPLHMLTVFTVLFLFILNTTSAVEPEQLKPCFERFDGYKLFDATPFHSEWRMKTEEECLPFCVKASSRCASIVYDKFNHICHYFSINGIEFESIERNSKMVYLQVAERRCIDEMVIAMDKEEKIVAQTSNIEQNLVNGGTILVNIADRNYKSSSTPEKYGTQAVETHVEVNLPEQPSDSTPIPQDQNLVNGHSSDLINNARDDLHTTNEEIETSTQPLTTTTAPFIDVNRDISEENHEIASPESKNENELKSNRETENPATIAEETSVNRDITNDYSKEIKASDSTQIENKRKDTQTSENAVHKNAPVPELNIDSAPSLLPVMSVFKATRLVPKTNVDYLNSDNNIRRHPSKKPDPPVEPNTLPPESFTKERFVMPEQISTTIQPNTNVRAFARRKETPPKAEILPSSIEETLAQRATEIESCQGDVHQIWVAVENTRINTNSSILKSGTDPAECMRLCKDFPIPKRSTLCDSFTYFENEQQCQLSAVADAFPNPSLFPSDKADFKTRVFHKFCYPETLTPFNGCSDFLAFRDYALEMTPKEVFDGLPRGRDGLSACIELCVLSNEFRCRSALFDSLSGVCKVFDEHSLSNPIAFKEHKSTGQLYFENGCIDGEVPQDTIEASVQRIQQSDAVVQPVRIDFKKVI